MSTAVRKRGITLRVFFRSSNWSRDPRLVAGTDPERGWYHWRLQAEVQYPTKCLQPTFLMGKSIAETLAGPLVDAPPEVMMSKEVELLKKGRRRDNVVTLRRGCSDRRAKRVFYAVRVTMHMNSSNGHPPEAASPTAGRRHVLLVNILPAVSEQQAHEKHH